MCGCLGRRLLSTRTHQMNYGLLFSYEATDTARRV